MTTRNSFDTRTEIRVGGQTVQIYSLPALEKAGFTGVSRLPYSMKILLENMLRREDDAFVKAADVRAIANWDAKANLEQEISFMPARVLLQDFTGVPCVVDLAAMRDAMVALNGDPDRINPLQPVELVIDHSVQVDYFARADAFALNAELEFARNRERYAFLRWGQRAFRNFEVVPPDTGIVHQVNIEHLARVIFSEQVDGKTVAYPDTLFGTDSHTTMVNGLGVVGWGVGGIEAEAAMLGQPSSMLIPQVLGVRLTGALPKGATATDLVLTITELLRKTGVVGKFVEFFGEGLKHLTIADRATLGNMCPEYGATVAIFPIDEMTLDYLRLTGRDESRVQLVETYARAQGLFRIEGAPDAIYSDTVELSLDSIEPSLAGPKRPQDRVSLRNAKAAFQVALPTMQVAPKPAKASDAGGARQGVAHATGAVAQSGVAVLDPALEELDHGAVVIAAITSCTNTSNPSVMIGAGLVAKKAVERGLVRKPWVKSSLAPGSKVVTEYLDAAGLSPYLNQLGFDLVGYGCTTCIGNSGPLPDEVSAVVREKSLVVCSVLSGNRNFEGRIQQDVRANYLASPPLVVAYALAGWITKDLTTEPLGEDQSGKPVFLKDIWPTEQELQETMQRAVHADMFRNSYRDVFKGDTRWQQLPVPRGQPICVGRLDVHPQADVSRRHDDDAAAAHRTARRPRVGAPRRQRHDGSHLACRSDQGRQPCGQIPDRARSEALRLQLVRRAAGQPRGDGAGHVCQHPAAEPDSAWNRRRMDDHPAGRRADDDLRRVGEVPPEQGAAAGNRRQGVWIRILARLGSEGDLPARRKGCNCRIVRAHSPQQPGQHGRTAAAVQDG